MSSSAELDGDAGVQALKPVFRRIVSGALLAGAEGSKLAGSQVASRINALRRSVDERYDSVSSLLLGSKESLERRTQIHSAFKICKETFIEVAGMMMGALEGGRDQ